VETSGCGDGRNICQQPSASRKTEVGLGDKTGAKVSRRKAMEKGCPPIALPIRLEGLVS